ncbi:MAG: DUF1080 domain-containing protein [Ginsengibacter sp.]
MKKNKILFILITSAIIISCSASKNVGDNKLSKQEKNEGYTLLFDGKTINGWRTYQNKKNDSWAVDNGALHCKGSTANYGSISADLMTTKQYENFDLSVDYKISLKGNSGILYMVTEEYPSSHLSGPEYQIIDDKNFPEKLEDWQHTAANYAMDPAPAAAPNPAGEWNNARIVVNKGHVEHWLNGKKVVEYELYSDDWKKKKLAGKWKDAPGYGMSKKGYITFQDHGSESWFKNIKIKEL